MPRRERLQLSCNECRKKKLSCDRARPCRRCFVSGRPNLCNFASVDGEPPVPGTSKELEIQRLETQKLKAEVVQLKSLLQQQDSGTTFIRQPSTLSARTATPIQASNSSFRHADFSHKHQDLDVPASNRSKRDVSSSISNSLSNTSADAQHTGGNRQHGVHESVHPLDRHPVSFWSKHCLMRFFQEMPTLFDFVDETAHRYLKPNGVFLRKVPVSFDKDGKHAHDLLPAIDDIKFLVGAYMMIQVDMYDLLGPFFQDSFEAWCEDRTDDSFTMLILAVLAVAANASSNVALKHRNNVIVWLNSCDAWLSERTTKQRSLIDYEISCLVYLAKRMNHISRETFGLETSKLIQLALLDDIPRRARHSNEHRRIWRALQQLDLQSSFELGFPTLLHSLDEKEMLLDQDDSESSHALSVLALRFEISRRLYSPGLTSAVTYEQVLTYTQQLNDLAEVISNLDSSFQRTLLLLQLKETILTLHHPYLKKQGLSDLLSFQAARDILMLELDAGPDTRLDLREDLLVAILTIAMLVLSQPSDSRSLIMTAVYETIELLTRCLTLVERRYLDNCRKEPWCFMASYGPLMMIKVHLGKEEKENAMRACADAFVALYQRDIEQIQDTSQGPTSNVTIADADQAQPGISDLDVFVDFDNLFDDSWMLTG